jgi:hypothetical protein
MFQTLKRLIEQLFGGPPIGRPRGNRPTDPDVGVREPKRRGRPGGRSAVAVAEPEEFPSIDACAPAVNVPPSRAAGRH